MQISARGDYAVRALCFLAAADGAGLCKADEVAAGQQIPRAFLDQVLRDLRRAGLVRSRRGPAGGHALARPAAGISVADAVRAVEGPLALVHGIRPEDLPYAGAAASLQDVWVALRAAVRDVLENTSVADLVAGSLPPQVTGRNDDAKAWESASRRPARVPVGQPPG